MKTAETLLVAAAVVLVFGPTAFWLLMERRIVRRAIAIEARQRTDREDGLDPKGESAGPQDIAQRRSR